MHQLTLAEIARGLADKKFSSEELTKTLLARIAQLDPQLNSFITLTEDLALEQAKAADARRANGETGALLGAPIGHKDLFCTLGVRTSCGSKMLDNFKAPYDATVVSKLAAAGAVTLGKTNMDEFAMGSANESSYYGAVKNPWNLEHVPGGSSGGSAAAVAARLLPAATGTDTGGSIRQPAALTNLTGLKPTYGRVSRWGMIAYASSLDQGGPLARTADVLDHGTELFKFFDAGVNQLGNTRVKTFAEVLFRYADAQALQRTIEVGAVVRHGFVDAGGVLRVEASHAL